LRNSWISRKCPFREMQKNAKKMGSDPRFTGKSGILAKFVKFCTFKKVRNSENFANCTFRTFAHFVKCAKCEIRESCESCELRSAQSIEQLGRSSESVRSSLDASCSCATATTPSTSTSTSSMPTTSTSRREQSWSHRVAECSAMSNYVEVRKLGGVATATLRALSVPHQIVWMILAILRNQKCDLFHKVYVDGPLAFN
jgi:hypothetical protein